MCERRVKVVVVGDSSVGKTSLYISYSSGVFPPSSGYIPRVFGCVEIKHEVDGVTYCVALWDTLGPLEDEWSRLRPLSYPDTHIFLFCFSLVDLASYENIRIGWYPEVSWHCPNALALLVGTKKDLRDRVQKDNVEHVNDGAENTKKEYLSPISYEQGAALAKELKMEYLECSAMTGEGVRSIFHRSLDLIAAKKWARPSGPACRCIIA